MSDYYEILGVAKDASQDDIRKAYRHKVKTNHPDTVQDATAKAKLEKAFKDISDAFDVLSDPQSRKTYDEHGKKGAERKFNIHDEMLNYISTLFNQAIDIFLAKKQKLSQVDYLAILSQQMTNNLRTMQEAVDTFKEQKLSLEDLRDRFIHKSNDETNIFKTSVESRIAILEDNIERLTLGLKLVIRSREELRAYDNIVDLMATQVNMFRADASTASVSNSHTFVFFTRQG